MIFSIIRGKKTLFQKIIFLILLIFPSVIFAKNSIRQLKNDSTRYSITYLLSYQPDSLNKNRILREQFILLVSDSLSYFSSIKFMEQEKYVAELFEKLSSGQINSLNQSNLPKTGFSFKIFSIISDSNIIKLSTIDLEKYGTIYSFPSWKMESNIDTVNGFVCRKATLDFAGRKYSAWYSLEIPIQEGPYIFKGLPGLVMKISDSKAHYTWEVVNILNKTAETVPEYSSKGVKWISRAEMLRLNSPEAKRNKLHEMGAFDDNWVGIEKEELRRRFEEKLRINNNNLELKE